MKCTEQGKNVRWDYKPNKCLVRQHCSALSDMQINKTNGEGDLYKLTFSLIVQHQFPCFQARLYGRLQAVRPNVYKQHTVLNLLRQIGEFIRNLYH